ncbi:type II secretion system protein N [Amantichitinum ursilacus]|uniref:Type II secretion system protein GspC N-terminal domain-containing protein n=1 Tax=Amantichitinum ursilacus TaxID=857265 RepID=A0A0N1JRZ1_9NEIS|nr:type II secretion system protein N [Amantichitinum ursilacus]KPC50305.1 hypothetical protein WG78_18080 [Amantichitinum ursilacus]
MVARAPLWLELVLLVVLAWTGAGLFWQIFAPHSPQVRLAPPIQPLPAQQMAWNNAPVWFGQAAVATGPTTLAAQLIAVIAGGDSYSAAIFTGLGPDPVAAKVGQELQPGVKLLKVTRDHVEVDNGGHTENIPLQGADASAAAAAGAQTGDPAQMQMQPVMTNAPPGGGPAIPPGIPGVEPAKPTAAAASSATQGSSSTVTRGQLAAAMQNGNVADWAKGIGNANGGGIQIDNAAAQPFAGPLGLQNGDVLKSINGQNLNTTSDISTLYTQFSQQSQVALVVVRHGSNLRLSYQIQP